MLYLIVHTLLNKNKLLMAANSIQIIIHTI